MATVKTLTSTGALPIKATVDDLLAAQQKYILTLNEARCTPDFPLEFRVLDAPNSIWQPVYENQEWDFKNEEYRVNPDYLAQIQSVIEAENSNG